MKTEWILISLIVFSVLYTFSCSTKDSPEKIFILPDHKKALLVKELKSKLGNRLGGDKKKAALFLIDNLYHSYYESIYLSDEYYYLKDLRDDDVQYFIDNIEQAFASYNKVSKEEVPFDLFLEYVLPHRMEAEKLENWRSQVLTDFSGLKDTLNHLSTQERVSKINDKLKHLFHFSSREPSSQSLNWADLRRIGKGDCWSMAKIALFSCRAFGLPVSIDFTPGWANINGGHAWNSLVTSDSSSTPFMGTEANPGEYAPLAFYGSSKKTAKVFRKTYSIQTNSLISTIGQRVLVPFPFMDSRIIDVTSQYMNTSKITIDLPSSDGQIFYLCVYNNGHWIPIDWSGNSSGNVAFENLGTDIIYSLGRFQDKTLIPIGTPMLLQKNDELHKLKTDYNKTIDIDIKTLQSLESDMLKLVNEGLERKEFASKINDLKKGIGRSKPQIGKQYTLYYWDNLWRNHQTVTADQDFLLFKDVPSNSIYKVIDASAISVRQGVERPFIYKGSDQMWY